MNQVSTLPGARIAASLAWHVRQRIGFWNQERNERLALQRILDRLRDPDCPQTRRSERSPVSGVILLTTHKSASTLMMQWLRRYAVVSLSRYFDYERCLWQRGDQLPIPNHRKFLTDHAGHLFPGGRELYGPIRYPIPINQSQVGQRQTVFFMRDPRDVLVSAFHSFGFIHPVPKNAEHAVTFLQERAQIQQEGLDAYVLRRAEQWMNPILKEFRDIRDRSIKTQTIHYHTFSRDPASVASSLLDAFGETRAPIREHMISFLAQQVPHLGTTVTHRSNPTHIRSGENRQFESMLAPQTRRALTDMLEAELIAWGFNP